MRPGRYVGHSLRPKPRLAPRLVREADTDPDAFCVATGPWRELPGSLTLCMVEAARLPPWRDDWGRAN